MSKRASDSGWVELTAAESESPAPPEVLIDAALVLRPRTGPQMLDLAMEVLVSRLLACIGICTLIWFPLRAIMPWFVDLMSEQQGVMGVEDMWTFVISILALSAAQTLVTVLSTTSVTVIVHAQLIGRPVSAVEALRQTVRRVFALVGVFLINVLAISIGLGLLLVLSVVCPPFFLAAFAFYIYFTWKFSLAPSALVLEDLGVFDSIRRSWTLTRGSLFRWMAVMVLVQILVMGFGAGLQVGDNVEIRDWFLDALPMPMGVFNVIFVGISSVFAGIATACGSAALTVFYLDGRIRREGFDLSMRLERLRSLGASNAGAAS